MRSWLFISIEALKINPELQNEHNNKNLIEMSINSNVIINFPRISNNNPEI
jgi:hypothetical protein